MTVDYPPIPGVEKYTDYYFFNGHEACSAKAYNNELYYYNGKGKERDLLFLVGEYQGMDSSGQYDLCQKLIDLVNWYLPLNLAI